MQVTVDQVDTYDAQLTSKIDALQTQLNTLMKCLNTKGSGSTPHVSTSIPTSGYFEESVFPFSKQSLQTPTHLFTPPDFFDSSCQFTPLAPFSDDLNSSVSRSTNATVTTISDAVDSTSDSITPDNISNQNDDSILIQNAIPS
ncbi:hypothetical protein AgCh_010122 [Apium graveolens]